MRDAPEPVALARVCPVFIVDSKPVQFPIHRLRLGRPHDAIGGALEDEQRDADLVQVVDGRALMPARVFLGAGAEDRFDVVALVAVRLQAEGVEIVEPEERDPAGEGSRAPVSRRPASSSRRRSRPRRPPDRRRISPRCAQSSTAPRLSCRSPVAPGGEQRLAVGAPVPQ